MNEEFEVLKQKTLDKKGFIDLTNQEEISLMGDFLKATEFENSYGKTFPSIYYDNGIKEFDILLNHSHDYEYGFCFNIIRYLNGVIFFLNHPKQGNIKVGIWPHRIIKYETIENQTVDVIKENKITNMISSGAWGEGALGVLSSIAIGKMIEKVQGIQTSQIEGVNYKIYYLDEFDNELCINFHSSKKSSISTSLFILTCIPGNDDSTTLKSASNKNCYIATACYGDIDCNEVKIFRYYRDHHLSKNYFGKLFIKIYYSISPYLVRYLMKYNKINFLVKKKILDKILNRIINR